MKMPFTLYKYIGKNFLLGIAVVFACLALMVIIFDSLEIIRRSFAKDVPIAVIIEMIFMRLPYASQRIIPFAILLGGILTFAKLTKSTELIVARSSGVSVWQFLTPPIFLAFMIGLFVMTVFNPLSSTMLLRFESLEGKYIKGQSSMLSLSSAGLWLRQPNEDNKGKTILNALRLSNEKIELFDLTIFVFDENNQFSKRINAESAMLKDGYWDIKNAWSSEIASTKSQNRANEQWLTDSANFYPNIQLKTNFSVHEIQDSFISPETMSFWELPGFITTLKEAGFSALKHLLHWHALIALPFFYSAMVFIAAAFSLRPPRRGKTGMLMVGGILSGFIIYFFSYLVSALGMSGRIPPELAAWSPVMISILIGLAVMMHLEDG